MSPSPFDLLRQMIRDGQAGEPFARRLAIQCTRRIDDPRARAKLHAEIEEAMAIAELGGIIGMPDQLAIAEAVRVVDTIEAAAEARLT